MMFILFYFLIVIFIGSRMRWLGNVMHECSHGAFVVSPKWNVFFGNLIAVLLFDCFDKYQKEHLNHHRFLGHPRKDPDYVQYRKIKCTVFQSNCVNVVVSILNPYNWWLSLKHVVILRAQNKRIVVLKILYLVCLSVGFYFAFREMFFYFLIPYMTSYQAFKIFSDLMDHDNSYEEPNMRDRAHNHICKSSILNWIFFPRNDVYHLVHHWYPKRSVSEYKAIHAQLMQKKGSYALKNHSCDLQKLSRSGIQK